MAPPYKLTYFDVKALGEPIRFLLSYGGIEFEDNRIQTESWPTLKRSPQKCQALRSASPDLKTCVRKTGTPFGQLPILEHNGKTAYQSIAICRYLAKQVKLTGKDDWEDLEIDATVDTITDLRLKLAPYHYEQDEKVKEAKAPPIFNEILPFYTQKLDTQVKNNNGYFVNGRLTWADVFFVAMLDYLSYMVKKDISANSPNLQILKENVLKVPSIRSWLEKRPKNDF